MTVVYSAKTFEMKMIIMTGASSGIGAAIAKELLDLDSIIFSISRNPEKATLKHPNLHYFRGDLLNQTDLNKWLSWIKNQQVTTINSLIQCAGFGIFKPLESISTEEINQLISLHLTIPIQLTRYFLSELLKSKGLLLAIGSHSGVQISRWGGPYAAAKAGLSYFMKGLFEDYRKQGLRVSQIIPDITNTPFYDSLDFKPAESVESAVNPDEIAQIIRHLYTMPEGTLISEIHFRPQKLQLIKKQTR